MLDPTLAADGLRRVSQTKTSDVLVMLEDDQSLLSNRHWPPQSWRDPQRLKPAKAQLAVALEVFIPGHLCIDRGEDGCPTWR